MDIQKLCLVNQIANDTYEELSAVDTMEDPDLEYMVQQLSNLADEISRITFEILESADTDDALGKLMAVRKSRIVHC